jgi:hypothetical protein
VIVDPIVWLACMGNLDRNTTLQNAVGKLSLESPGIADPNLAATIEAAQAALRSKAPTGQFLADGLSEAIERAHQESSKANNERNQRRLQLCTWVGLIC